MLDLRVSRDGTVVGATSWILSYVDLSNELLLRVSCGIALFASQRPGNLSATQPALLAIDSENRNLSSFCIRECNSAVPAEVHFY